MAVSPPPQSAVLPPSPTRTAPGIHTFAVPKRMGLGIILGGGLDREGGPHVYIERMLAGMDAAKVVLHKYNNDQYSNLIIHVIVSNHS